MNIRYRISFSILVAATVGILLTACGGKPFNYRPIHEIPEGPGILTNQSDGAVLYDSKNGGLLQTVDKKPKNQKVSEAEKATTTETDGVDRGHPDFKEFEEYQRWKKWREKSKDSTEYQEFIEWQEWKSYQEWKRQKPKSQ